MSESNVTSVEPEPTSRARGLARRVTALVVVAFLTGGAAGGWAVWRLATRHRHPDAQAQAAAAPVTKPKRLFQCPMHPQVTSDHPGDCPICGMKLVEVVPDATPEQAASTVPGLAAVTIDPQRQQLIGLRTAKVSKGPMGASWRTVARIDVAPSHVRKINVKVEGFVERMYVDFVGQSVRKGQPLFAVYSPELLAAQNEYLLALATRDSLAKGGAATAGNGDSLVTAARRKLELWDVPAAELERLERTRQPSKNLTVVSPIAGVVTAKNVVQGARVSPGEAPYEITDLGEVWVMADAYEGDVARIRSGSKATLTLAAYPGREFGGMVAFVDPLLDAKTRTLKVHMHFANPSRLLKPGMFGEVTLQGVAREGLLIPADAVIRTGTQDVVFVALGAGKLAPRVVQLGDRAGDQVEVKSGLGEGQEVVTRANFLVDSESQLRASLAAIGGK